MAVKYIKDKETLELAEALASRLHTTVEDAVRGAIRDRLAQVDREHAPQRDGRESIQRWLKRLDLPDPEPRDRLLADEVAAGIVSEHQLPHDMAYRLATYAQWKGWSGEDLDAEIAWHKQVLANPDVEERRLPGWVEHILRITAWPDKDPNLTRESLDAEIYDEDGLPR